MILLFEYLNKREINAMSKVNDIKTEFGKIAIGSVLLIIAYPDYGIIFWTLTIKAFLGNNIKMKILCLSNGNYDGLGEIRKKELIMFPEL